MRKRAIWIVICLVMCLAMGAIGGTAMAEEPKNVKTAGETIYVRSRITQEQAEKEYLNGLFGLPVTPAEELPRLRGTAGGSRFAEGSQEQKLYNALKDRVTAAAAGTLAYTVFEFTTDQIDAMVFNGDNGALAEGESVFDANGDVSEAMENAIGTNLVQLVSDVISAVTFDCPYECYWLDAGDGGFGLVWNYSDFIDTPGEKSVTVDTIYVLMKVAEDYRATASDEYTINTELINSAQTAAANARAIVNQNAGKSDYAKLMTYKRKICELTDYNEDAAEGKHLHDYGNPWQLVWVFDGNPETRVVCKGYSKAFQYLCEQSRWSGDVEVISVTGILWHKTENGNNISWDPEVHMWNNVRMNGQNYLADVTNSNDGAMGEFGGLFLDGYDSTGTDSNGNTIYFYTTEGKTTDEYIWFPSEAGYSYDANTANAFEEDRLEPADTAAEPEPDIWSGWTFGEVGEGIDRGWVLHITGSGETPDYSSAEKTPWYSQTAGHENIRTLSGFGHMLMMCITQSIPELCGTVRFCGHFPRQFPHDILSEKNILQR